MALRETALLDAEVDDAAIDLLDGGVIFIEPGLRGTISLSTNFRTLSRNASSSSEVM